MQLVEAAAEQSHSQKQVLKVVADAVDVLRGSPSAEFSSELHTQNFRCLELPWRIH